MHDTLITIILHSMKFSVQLTRAIIHEYLPVFLSMFRDKPAIYVTVMLMAV